MADSSDSSEAPAAGAAAPPQRAPRGVPQNCADAHAAMSRRVTKLESARWALWTTVAAVAAASALVVIVLWTGGRSLWSRWRGKEHA